MIIGELNLVVKSKRYKVTLFLFNTNNFVKYFYGYIVYLNISIPVKAAFIPMKNYYLFVIMNKERKYPEVFKVLNDKMHY